MELMKDKVWSILKTDAVNETRNISAERYVWNRVWIPTWVPVWEQTLDPLVEDFHERCE